MENILWNTWQYLVDVFDCFLMVDCKMKLDT